MTGLVLLDTACAWAASATLITTDKDFDPLHGEFIQRVYFE
jgi:hypothetical protein